MYTCGPTVYDLAHIGNFRTFVFEDILRRYLRFKGYRVIQVMNITDIDDKTIAGARREGVDLDHYTARYIDAFFEDLDTLGIERAEYYPRATEHVEDMVKGGMRTRERAPSISVSPSSPGTATFRAGRSRAGRESSMMMNTEARMQGTLCYGRAGVGMSRPGRCHSEGEGLDGTSNVRP
jgi:hypothetical protein